jgi:predicted branched-subunit amino acid permease
VTDETFAILTLGNEADSQQRTPAFMSGLMITAYLGWVSGTLVGGLGANFIPPQITTAMTVGLYGLFIGLLVPSAKKSRPFALITALSMIINWVLGHWVESGWAIVIATVLAAGVGIPLIGGEE